MKLRTFLIVFVIALLGAGGYFGYVWYFDKNKPNDVTAFVPKDAAVVFEVQNVSALYNQSAEYKTFNTILSSDYVADFQQHLQLLDQTLSYHKSSLQQLLSGDEKLLVTFSGSDLQMPLLLLELNDEERNVFKTLYANATVTKSQIDHAGVNINTIEHPEVGNAFSFFIQGHVLVAGYSTEQLKQVIDQQSGKGQSRFYKHFSQLTLSESISDDIHMYVDYNLVSGVFDWMARSGESNGLEYLGNYSFFDIKVEDERLGLSGYTYGFDTLNTFFKCFDEQTAPGFELKNYVSSNTAMLYYWGISDYQKLKESLQDYWYDTEYEQPEVVFDADQFGEFVGEEVALAVFEVEQGYHDKITYVKSNDASRFIERLHDLGGAMNDSSRWEMYSNITIANLGVAEFPESLFGQHFSGYEETYYAQIGDYVVFGNTSQAIKLLINDLSVDNVWGKIISINRFLEDFYDGANVAMISDIGKSQKSLKEITSQKLLDLLDQFNPIMKSTSFFGIQFNNEAKNNQIYTSASLQFVDKGQEEEQPQEDEETILSKVLVEEGIVGRPYIMKNHSTGGNEILLETRDSAIVLFDMKGEKLWKTKIDGPIVSKIQQVDIYRNRKLQYLFATQNKVYCIDRLGRPVEKYPFALPDDKIIQTLSVIDYDGSRKYRFLVADTTGGLFIYNVKAENLKGWQPNQLDSPLGPEAMHVRARGKDFMIAVEEKGRLNVFSRRGSLVAGFPIDLSSACTDQIIPEKGPSIRKSYINLVTKDREYYRIGFNGKVDKTELLGASGDLVHIFEGADKKGVVFAVINAERVRFLTSEMDLLFDVEMPGVTDVQRLSVSGKVIYAVHHEKLSQSFIYDESGKRLVENPIESNGHLDITYSSDAELYSVYSSIDNYLNITVFQ